MSNGLTGSNRSLSAVKIAGLSIADFTALPLSDARPAVDKIRGKLTLRQRKIAGRPLAEIAERIDFLLDVGLGYLTLARSAATLSGGEAQRIRLATQIGSRLRGVLYVLDEPSIGLHARDNDRLLSTLETLRDLGNTLILVEHDREVINAADHLLDFGPGAGDQGGEITQLVGELLIDANVAGLGWRAIFWINVPIGLAALAATPRLLRESRAEHAGRIAGRGKMQRHRISAERPLTAIDAAKRRG